MTHRSMLCEESLEENVLIELKCRAKLNYVGDNKLQPGAGGWRQQDAR